MQSYHTPKHPENTEPPVHVRPLNLFPSLPLRLYRNPSSWFALYREKNGSCPIKFVFLPKQAQRNWHGHGTGVVNFLPSNPFSPTFRLRPPCQTMIMLSSHRPKPRIGLISSNRTYHGTPFTTDRLHLQPCHPKFSPHHRRERHWNLTKYTTRPPHSRLFFSLLNDKW